MTDQAFGNWFAGFAAGEGCFDIPQCRGHPSCRFSIRLRDDDELILEEIRERLNIGTIRRSHDPSKSRPGSKPQAGWWVQSKVDCIVLRDTFLTYPLRAKKAEDFKIWSEALDCILSHQYGSSWDDVFDAKHRLEAGRKYK